jgi:hypothetical protein
MNDLCKLNCRYCKCLLTFWYSRLMINRSDGMPVLTWRRSSGYHNSSHDVWSAVLLFRLSHEICILSAEEVMHLIGNLHVALQLLLYEFVKTFTCSNRLLQSRTVTFTLQLTEVDLWMCTLQRKLFCYGVCQWSRKNAGVDSSICHSTTTGQLACRKALHFACNVILIDRWWMFNGPTI